MNNQKTIVVRLIGGLGNQLFQMQFAVNFQKNSQIPFEIDDSYLFNSKKKHEKLAISELITSIPVNRLSWYELKIKRFLERCFFKFNLKCPVWLSPIFVFENSCNKFSVTKKLVIDGFWQDKKYLNISFVNNLRNVLKKLNKSNASKKSVCVHIRRGDYVTNREWFIRQQTTLPLSYYINAFNYFRKKISNPVFEIYTDDEDWAIKIFSNMNDITIISSGHLKPFHLLAKMSSYSNFIIANSTLSWWAAVSSDNGLQKRVVLPKKWNKNVTCEKFKLDNWIEM